MDLNLKIEQQINLDTMYQNIADTLIESAVVTVDMLFTDYKDGSIDPKTIKTAIRNFNCARVKNGNILDLYNLVKDIFVALIAMNIPDCNINYVYIESNGVNVNMAAYQLE
jgi:hypothetical protein